MAFHSQYDFIKFLRQQGAASASSLQEQEHYRHQSAVVW
ncbi:hypothetical protein T06_14444 [Trichinella sp. T6]|nr:hypothetical protein T06_14444 [Trichinella sp. T6]